MLRNSIRLRLLLVLLLLTLAPLTLFAYRTTQVDEQNSRDAASARLLGQAQRTSDAIAAAVTTYARYAGFLAGLEGVKKAAGIRPFDLVANPFDDQVQALNATEPRITGAYLTTPGGTFIHGGTLLGTATFSPASDLPLDARDPALGALLAAAVRGQPAAALLLGRPSPDPGGDLWVAARLLDRGSAAAVILLRVDARVLLAAPSMADAGGIGTQLVAGDLLYDREAASGLARGRLQAMDAALRVPGLITEGHPELRPIVAGHGGSYSSNGVRFTGVAVPVAGEGLSLPGWRVLARQPTSQILAGAGDNRNRLWLAILASALTLALGLALSLTVFVTRPLARLREVVHGIARGRLDVSMPQAGRDELGELTAAIESMRHGLRADAEAAQRRARGLSDQVLGFTEAIEPIAQGQLYRRIPLVNDPDSPLLDTVEATNNLIRRFRRVVANVKEAVQAVVESSATVRSRIDEAVQDAEGQQAQLEHQRQLVGAMSRQAMAAGEAAQATATATGLVDARVKEGNAALGAVSASSDGIRQRTLENTNRIKKLQDTAVNLTALVGQVQEMAGSLQLLAYNGTLSAGRIAGGDPAFARMAEETQGVATSFEATLTEIRAAVEAAQRDIGAVIISGEAVAQDVITALRARDELTTVFGGLAEMVTVLGGAAGAAQVKAAEQTRLATAVRDGNDLVAQAYERIRINLEVAAEEIAQRADDFDRLAASVGDLQVEAPPTGALQVGPRSAA